MNQQGQSPEQASHQLRDQGPLIGAINKAQLPHQGMSERQVALVISHKRLEEGDRLVEQAVYTARGDISPFNDLHHLVMEHHD